MRLQGSFRGRPLGTRRWEPVSNVPSYPLILSHFLTFLFLNTTAGAAFSSPSSCLTGAAAGAFTSGIVSSGLSSAGSSPLTCSSSSFLTSSVFGFLATQHQGTRPRLLLLHNLFADGLPTSYTGNLPLQLLRSRRFRWMLFWCFPEAS
ncbi:hypothetical protein KC357_g152 [Hortaea werneckii]|nr:hypothetical protein KC357_g152 [Hortaea werneckii]